MPPHPDPPPWAPPWAQYGTGPPEAWRRWRRRWFAVVVAVIGVATTFGASWAQPAARPADGGAVLLALVAPGALAFLMPRHTVAATLASVGGIGVFVALGYPWSGALLGPVAVLLDVMRSGRARRAQAVAYGGAALLLGTLLAAGALRPEPPRLATLLLGTGWLLVLLTFAQRRREWAARRAADHATAEQRAAERRAAEAQSQAERQATAVAAERLRIARELHDVLAHSLSAISVQAGVGLHLLDRSPDQARTALANIRTTSIDALDEVRAVLGVVRAGPETHAADVVRAGSESHAAGVTGADSSVTRAGRRGAGRAAPGNRERPAADVPESPDDDDVAPRAPLWTVAALPRLVELAGTDRQTATLDLDPRADDLPEIHAGVVFRVVQEALTNARRHAPDATRVDVRVAVVGEGPGRAVEVTVDDDGADPGRPAAGDERISSPGVGAPGPGAPRVGAPGLGAPGGAAGPGRSGSAPAGYGLLGMRERVEGAGGSVDTGPTDRGWRVRAVLPWPDVPVTLAARIVPGEPEAPTTPTRPASAIPPGLAPTEPAGPAPTESAAPVPAKPPAPAPAEPAGPVPAKPPAPAPAEPAGPTPARPTGPHASPSTDPDSDPRDPA